MLCFPSFAHAEKKTPPARWARNKFVYSQMTIYRIVCAAFLLHISALFVCQWPILRLCGRNAAPSIKIRMS